MSDLQINGKYAVVAGNGPSLADIDYTRLPPPPPQFCDGYDVFRCNQFYFEDKYYFGKNVKFAFSIPTNLFEQYYTYATLSYKKEYNIKHICVSDFNLTHMDSFYYQHLDIFDGVIAGSTYISKLQAFYNLMRYNEVYKNKRITSGIYMCAFAVAMGYKEIYIAGIDLYSANRAYAFETLKPNLLRIHPNFALNPGDFHTKETDVLALKFLADNYDVKFYTICPNSPLAEYIALADSNDKNKFTPITKPQDSIKDMLIPNKSSYEALNIGVEKKFHKYQPQPIVNKEEEIKDEERIMIMRQIQEQIGLHNSYIKNNSVYVLCGFIYKFIKDITHLPRDIKRFMKGRKIYKEVLEKSNTMGGGGANSLFL